MKNYVITTDSTCDLPKEYLEKNNIKVLPLYYNFDGVVFGEGNELEPKEFYDKMRAGAMPTTMAANPDTAKELFTNIIKEGFDIIHIAFSSALSGSCSVAGTVARDLCDENPDVKITVVDSLCASLGEGLLVHKAIQQQESGKTYEEVVEWLENNKQNLCHNFTVDDLHHLHRGGRVSKTTAIIGSLINVKPVLQVDSEGRLVPFTNVRGRKKALMTLVDTMENSINGFKDQNDIVFISHGDSLADAEYVASLIKERFGIQNILINYISPTIGAHAGPGTIALFYYGQSRK